MNEFEHIEVENSNLPELINDIEEYMKNREKNEVSIIDVIDLTIELMQTVENFKNLKGKEKCDVIIEALLQVDVFPGDIIIIPESWF